MCQVVVSFGMDCLRVWVWVLFLEFEFAFSSVRHFYCCGVLFVGFWCLFNVVSVESIVLLFIVAMCRTYGVTV